VQIQVLVLAHLQDQAHLQVLVHLLDLVLAHLLDQVQDQLKVLVQV
jgi:hypothetical protein